LLRDKIIKDKFGDSISNFLPANKQRRMSTPKGAGEYSQERKGKKKDALEATLYRT
jgi:hypothetical protein